MITEYYKFLNESKSNKWKKTDPEYYGINDYSWNGGFLDCFQPVFLQNYNFHTLPFNFGYVEHFECRFTKLNSLVGLPKQIKGSLIISNNNLTNLEHCPKVINGIFDCSYNKITSLVGAPEEVKEYFNCAHNKITNLVGCPKILGNDFLGAENELTSLEGFPEKSNGLFMVWKNKLKDLKGIPKIINGDFYCSSNNLTSLDDCPLIINGDFYYESNYLDLEKDYPYDIRVSGKIETDGIFDKINKLVERNKEKFEPLKGEARIKFHQMVIRLDPSFIKYYHTIPSPSKKTILLDI